MAELLTITKTVSLRSYHSFQSGHNKNAFVDLAGDPAAGYIFPMTDPMQPRSGVRQGDHPPRVTPIQLQVRLKVNLDIRIYRHRYAVPGRGPLEPRVKMRLLTTS